MSSSSERPAPGSGRSWRTRLALLGGSTLFALLLAEVLLRAFVPVPEMGKVFVEAADPEVLYEPRAGAVWTGRTEPSAAPATISIDDAGARRVDGGDASCGTVWVAGDSFAFGWGVSDREVYAALLGPSLKKRIGCRPIVRNWAVGGYHLGQTDARLAGLLRSHPTPQVLVVHLADNDGMVDVNWANPLGLPQGFVNASAILSTLSVVAVARRSAASEFNDGDSARLAARLEALAATTEAVPHRLLLVQPETGEVDQEAARSRFPGAISLDACNQDHALHLSEDDPHYSSAGHRCLAELITPEVAAWLSPAPGR